MRVLTHQAENCGDLDVWPLRPTRVIEFRFCIDALTRPGITDAPYLLRFQDREYGEMHCAILTPGTCPDQHKVWYHAQGPGPILSYGRWAKFRL